MFYDNVAVLYEFMPSRSDRHIPSTAFSTFKGYTQPLRSIPCPFPPFARFFPLFYYFLDNFSHSLSLSPRSFEAWINFTASRKA